MHRFIQSAYSHAPRSIVLAGDTSKLIPQAITRIPAESFRNIDITVRGRMATLLPTPSRATSPPRLLATDLVARIESANSAQVSAAANYSATGNELLPLVKRLLNEQS